MPYSPEQSKEAKLPKWATNLFARILTAAALLDPRERSEGDEGIDIAEIRFADGTTASVAPAHETPAVPETYPENFRETLEVSQIEPVSPGTVALVDSDGHKELLTFSDVRNLVRNKQTPNLQAKKSEMNFLALVLGPNPHMSNFVIKISLKNAPGRDWGITEDQLELLISIAGVQESERGHLSRLQQKFTESQIVLLED